MYFYFISFFVSKIFHIFAVFKHFNDWWSKSAHLFGGFFIPNWIVSFHTLRLLFERKILQAAYTPVNLL